LEYDHIAEEDVIKLYNNAVGLASKLGDNGSKMLVE